MTPSFSFLKSLAGLRPSSLTRSEDGEDFGLEQDSGNGGFGATIRENAVETVIIIVALIVIGAVAVGWI